MHAFVWSLHFYSISLLWFLTNLKTLQVLFESWQIFFFNEGVTILFCFSVYYCKMLMYSVSFFFIYNFFKRLRTLCFSSMFLYNWWLFKELARHELFSHTHTHTYISTYKKIHSYVHSFRRTILQYYIIH